MSNDIATPGKHQDQEGFTRAVFEPEKKSSICAKGCVSGPVTDKGVRLVANVNDEDVGAVKTRCGSDSVFIPPDMGRGQSVKVWTTER